MASVSRDSYTSRRENRELPMLNRRNFIKASAAALPMTAALHALNPTSTLSAKKLMRLP